MGGRKEVISSAEDMEKAKKDRPNDGLVARALEDVSLYKLAEKFGAEIMWWPFDRAKAMLHVMGVEAEIQKKNRPKKTPPQKNDVR